jgi:hypothetical protein
MLGFFSGTQKYWNCRFGLLLKKGIFGWMDVCKSSFKDGLLQ